MEVHRLQWSNHTTAIFRDLGQQIAKKTVLLPGGQTRLTQYFTPECLFI